MGRAKETGSLPQQPLQTEVTPTETMNDGKRIVVGLAKDINFEDFVKAVGGQVVKDGVTFSEDLAGWSGSLTWQDTYQVPVPNPYFHEFVPKTRDVRGRNLHFSAHFWDGMPDSDSREIDRQKFDNAGYVLVIGKPEESFATFLEPSTESDSQLSGILVARGAVSSFSGFKQMFSPAIQEAARISRFKAS